MKGGGFAILALAAVLAALESRPVSAAGRQLGIDTLRDKIRGGWAGHMVGVSWGAPTEFHYQGTVIPDADVPLWSPALVNDSYAQDDLYVQMPFLGAMVDGGANCDWTKFGEYFRSFTGPLAHANMIGRQNLLNGWQVPDSGHYSRNAHCDDIDWQIEWNFGGLVAPGQPNAAAELTWRAGHTMNYGDGVYGGVFIAAMQAEAYCAINVDQIVEAGRQAIPAGSKYRQVIEDVIAWKNQGRTWQQSWQLLQNKWGNTDRCPDGVNQAFNIDAKLNGAYVLLGLLYGGSDFELSMRIAMRCGQDSDCNPGSVGAILGTFYGLSGMPAKFHSGLDYARTFYGTAYTLNEVTGISETMARQILALTGGTTAGSGSSETWTIPCGPVTPLILEQWPAASNTPPTLTASLLARSDLTVTLSASAADLDGINGYQWFFGDLTFTNGPAVTHTYAQSGAYSIVCYVADNLGNTSWRVLGIEVSPPDTAPPSLVAMAATSTNEVSVFFSEPVDPSSATNAANYSIRPGVAISRLSVGMDSKTVVLTTSALVGGILYTGMVSAVRDTAMAPNTIAPNSQATFARLPMVTWHSHDAAMSPGTPQGRVMDEEGLVTAELEFYESVNNGGVARGSLFNVLNPGPHVEDFNAVENYWASTSGKAYPYVGKSLFGRAAGEGNVPPPLGVRDLQCHPPENDHLVVAAFVVPMEGAYGLTDLAVRRLVPTGSVEYKVFNKDRLVVARVPAAGGSAWVRDSDLHSLGWLTTGDRIYFAVGRDGSYVCDATEIAWTLTAQPAHKGKGSLLCSKAVIPSTVNLTTEGPVDWAHWGLDSSASFNHKTGVTSRIGNYTVIGITSAVRYQDNPNVYSRFDGTPTPRNAGTPTGVYIFGVLSNGFRLTVPADTTVQTLKLYVGVWDAQGRLEASLSDNSALPFRDTTLINTNGTSNSVYTIDFRAAGSGNSLNIEWTIQTLYRPVYGNVTLQAAALGLAPLPSWKCSYFDPGELRDPTLSGDTADPDGDGIPNLLEYALIGDPREANLLILPRVSTANDRLIMSYTRRKHPTDVSYVVKTSSEADQGWTTAGVAEQVLTEGPGRQHVQATDPTSISTTRKHFLKLEVSH